MSNQKILNDKRIIRAENFLLLIKEAGNVSKLARACGYHNPASLHQLRARIESGTGPRGITNILAAKLEAGMNKPEGWLDRRHYPAPTIEDPASEIIQNENAPNLIEPATENATPNAVSQPVFTNNTSLEHPVHTRIITVTRNTNETQITLTLNLDGTGKSRFDTGVPFLEHMLDQVARHGLIDLGITCKGDLHIDDHHTVEDIGIVFGQALRQALGNKAGIRRYGHAYVPLDEALSRVVIDLSGRPGLVYNIDFTRALIGKFDVDLFSEFFHGVVNHSMMTLHIDNLRGNNAHHQAETVFKAFGRALRMAIEYDERMMGKMPSTKGTLTA